jgi:phosphatidylserine decarboxylase
MTEKSTNHLQDVYNSIKNGLTPIHPEGYKFATIAALIGLALSWLIWDDLLVVGIVLALYCLYFFRDPERFPPENDAAILSPADGLVQKITEVTPPEELELGDKPMKRISIFLNVFDVHINRLPVTGSVAHMEYHKGKFLNAELDKASEENERQSITLEHKKGKIGVVQIAGLIARRIVCNLEDDQTVTAGERFGLIRFGSRVDVYLPSQAIIKVREGQRSIGAETILAEWK